MPSPTLHSSSSTTSSRSRKSTSSRTILSSRGQRLAAQAQPARAPAAITSLSSDHYPKPCPIPIAHINDGRVRLPCYVGYTLSTPQEVLDLAQKSQTTSNPYGIPQTIVQPMSTAIQVTHSLRVYCHALNCGQLLNRVVPQSRKFRQPIHHPTQ